MTEPNTPHVLNGMNNLIFGGRDTPKLNEALAKFQADMPTLQRDRLVHVETKGEKPDYEYSYATLANLTEVAMPLLGKHGLSFTALPGRGSDGKGMSLFYTLRHASGEMIGGEFPLSAEGGIQVLGGRITYIRRYCLLAATGLAAAEDDDAATAQMADEAAGPTAQRRAPRQRAAQPAAARATGTAQRSDATRRAVTGQAEGSAPQTEGGDNVPEPHDPDGPITSNQQQKLIMQFKDLTITGPDGQPMPVSREQRLAIMSRLMKRELGSQKELTKGEAHNLIDWVGQALETPDPILTLRGIAEGTTATNTNAEGAQE